MSEDEIRGTLSNNGYNTAMIDTLIKNNIAIAENITTDIDLNQVLFPNYETPEDIKELYEKYKDQLIIKE